MRYILNSAVITTEGKYDYRLVSVEQAREWFFSAHSISTIGYKETAYALSILLDPCGRVSIPVNRLQIRMQSGDEALVFRLTIRLDDPSLKGKLDCNFIEKYSEIGILRKL